MAPFALSVGYFFAQVAGAFGVTSVWWLIPIMAVGVFSYVWTVLFMRKSWLLTRRLMPLSNLLMMGMMAWIGATLGAFTPPLAALIILAVLAVYDAISVWKTEHMQGWAKEFLKQRIVPGLAVAKRKPESWALLGGGDVFAIIFVAGSFWKSSPWVSFVSFIGMSGAVVLLFLASKKGRFYPALPFILAGELGVLCVAWLVL